MAAAQSLWDVTKAIPEAKQDGAIEDRNKIFNRYFIENNTPLAYKWKAPQKAIRNE